MQFCPCHKGIRQILPQRIERSRAVPARAAIACQQSAMQELGRAQSRTLRPVTAQGIPETASRQTVKRFWPICTCISRCCSFISLDSALSLFSTQVSEVLLWY